MGHLARAENTGNVALDGADRIEVVNKVGCSPSGLELDPSPPMQVELVGCMLSVRKIDSDGEMLQLSREEADLTRYLSSADKGPTLTHIHDSAQKHVGHDTLVLFLT